MRPVVFERPSTLQEAAQPPAGSAALPPTSAPHQFLAGATTLADLMKLGVMQPEVLVEVDVLPGDALRRISADDRELRLGALVRMSEAEDHAAILGRYPVIADTLKLAASPQIRNMASLAGNVLQRTRCEYFRETSWPCNKRKPGSGCSAIGGFNRQHAILGTSEACIATYPGDFAQALVALDADLEITGPDGPRRIPFAELHRLPGDRPDVETTLRPGDLITAILVPATPAAVRSRYLKVRDRTSYAFAVASAAVALDLDGDVVRDARIALGGIATVPWRARAAEAALRGKPLDEASAGAAADAELSAARTFEHNAFKRPLAKETLVRALLETRDMQVSR